MTDPDPVVVLGAVLWALATVAVLCAVAAWA